jgi:hypothetical protein
MSSQPGVFSCRLNLGAIETSLRTLQQTFPIVNGRVASRRDAMSDEVVTNLVAGYRFVDRVIADRIDLFALGNSKHLLEINTLVLCGADPKERIDYAKHLKANEKYFYDTRVGGIGETLDWLARHRKESLWFRAAGMYIRILSHPELFIEGNHRAGALIVSYMLLREGQPPFVLTNKNMRSYFDFSTLIEKAKKGSLTMMFRQSRIKQSFANFLSHEADPKYVLQPIERCSLS